MATVYPASSINTAISKARAAGINTDAFLENVNYIEQNPTPYIYNSLVNQNIKLSQKIIDKNTNNSTEDKRSYYQLQKNATVEYVYEFLYWVYYGVLIAFLMVYYMKYAKSMFFFVLLAVLLFFYPYWMIYVERYLVIVYRFIAALIFGTPFSLPKQLYVVNTPNGSNLRF